jgi:hypothetical protein
VDAVSEWISVEEQLPPKRQDRSDISTMVMIAKTNGDIRVGCVYFRGDGSMKWCDAEGNYLSNHSHWMPLPEPPK